MATNEEEVRQLAHQIWEAEGRPDGQSDRHWQEARTLAEKEHGAKKVGLKRSIDPSEAKGETEPAQPDQT